MLSVVNRGTVTGSDVDGIPYQIVDGYMPSSYQGLPLALIKTNGIPEPLIATPDVEVLDGYLRTEGYVLGNVGVLQPTVQPIVINGYTKKTVTPTEG